MRNAFFETIEELETELGRPPYGREIIDAYRTRKAWISPPSPMIHNFIIYDMAKDDILYVTPTFDQYSTKPVEGFKKPSAWFREDPKFAGLKVDPEGHIVMDTRQTINFQELKAAF